MSNFPSITIYRLNNELVLKQDYSNYNIEIVDDFNIVTQQSNYLCYLYPDFNFVNNEVLSLAINKFQEYPMINGIYGDVVINDNISYSPTFNIANIDRKIIVNSPLIVNKPLQFNQKIKHLHYMSCLFNTVQNTIWYHLPHPLFTISSIKATDIQSDIKEIYGIR